MPGAWELSGPSVLVCTITARDAVPFKWAHALRNLRLPAGHGITTLSGMPFDHARNDGVRHMLEGGYRWLLFIDDDVVVPDNTFERLSSHNLDIVSGLYWRRSPPLPHPVMMRETKQGPAWIDQFVPGSLVEADLVGAGCLLIHRRVLETLDKPLNNRWFQWHMEPASATDKCSEDYFFCRQAKRLGGFKIVVDTSIQCEHMGLASSSVYGYKPATL